MSIPDELAQQDLAAAYALGSLTPEEARRFEAYLATSPQAQREMAELQEAAALLAASPQPAERPAGDLRDRVLAAVDAARARSGPGAADRPDFAAVPASGARRAASSRGIRLIVWGLLAASMVAAIGFGLQSQSLARRLAASDSLVVQQRDTLTRLMQALEQQSQRLQRLESTLASIF